MTKDMKIRASRAKDLLNSTSFNEAMKEVREAQINVFLSSSHNDLETRERAHSIVLALSAIEHELTTAIADFEMLELNSFSPQMNTRFQLNG